MAKKANKQLEEQLINALNLNSANDLVDFLSKLSEEERLSLGKATREWITMRAALFLSRNLRDAERENLLFIIQLAAIATLDIKTLGKQLGTDSVRFTVNSEKAALAILPIRNRDFVNDYLLRVDTKWPLYWKCYQKGLCLRRLDEAALASLLSHCGYPAWKSDDENLSIVQIWEKYPELFELEFWYIFEHEFSKPFGFAYGDSRGHGSRNWTDAFLELVDRKHVQRERLLDATLGTLRFSYPDNEMRWYSNLHRKMQPSTEEVKVREEKYLDLLDNRNPSTVALGFEMLVQLDKAGQLDDRLFLQRVGPIFNEKPKSRPKTAVGILDRIAKRNKSMQNEAVRVALSALSHDAVDVQTAAAKLILQHLDSTDGETVSQIRNMQPSLHGSVQAMLTKLSADTVPQTSSVSLVEITPRRFGPLDLNRLESLPKLNPVETVDELIDLATKVLATPSEIDEIEMLVDGIMRLHHLRDVDFVRKTSALRKSVLEGKLFRWAQNNYLFGKYLACIVSVWLADSVTVNPETRSIKFQIGERTSSFMVSNRLFAETYFGNLQIGHAERIANGIVLQPLSTPTHHGGWIDPITLVDRIKLDSHKLKQHDTLDKVLSLCRSVEQEPELIQQDGWSYDVCEDTVRHDFPLLSFLHVAAATAPEIKYVQFLIDHGLDRDHLNEYGTPPIFYAACNSNIEMLRFFIELGADMFSETRSAETLLHFAVANNHNIDVVKYLVTAGMDVNKLTKPFSETPLHYAASAGNIEAMLYLAENGADLNANSHHFSGETPFMVLMGDDSVDIDIPSVERFIELGADPNSLDRRNYTPFYCAGTRSLEIEKCLVEHGAKIIHSDLPGIAPLHSAARNPCLDNIKYLIEQGADVRAANPDGMTLLHVAARSNPNVEMLKFLVDQGVDINAKRDETQMAIHDALERRCDFETLKFFVENGSNLNTRGSSWHHTPLEEIVLWCDSDTYRNKYECVKYLVEHGADWTVRTCYGASLLHHSDDLRLTEYLVSLGLDVNAKDDHGNTPVLYAACRRRHSPDVLKYLVSQGGNLDVRNNGGETPIHRAAGRQSSDILEYLVSQGVTIDIRDDKGKTPLHHAVLWDQGSPKVWKYLIDNGADIYCKDNEGKTSLDLASCDEKKNLLLELSNPTGETP